MPGLLFSSCVAGLLTLVNGVLLWNWRRPGDARSQLLESGLLQYQAEELTLGKYMTNIG